MENYYKYYSNQQSTFITITNICISELIYTKRHKIKIFKEYDYLEIITLKFNILYSSPVPNIPIRRAKYFHQLLTGVFVINTICMLLPKS